MFKNTFKTIYKPRNLFRGFFYSKSLKQRFRLFILIQSILSIPVRSNEGYHLRLQQQG